MSSLERCVFSSSAHFFNQLVWFFGVELYEFFVCLDINPLSDISFANIFSHPVGGLFFLLIVSFTVQKHFGLK